MPVRVTSPHLTSPSPLISLNIIIRIIHSTRSTRVTFTAALSLHPISFRSQLKMTESTQSYFETLPVELILLICKFLDRAEIASLSLCNHRLLDIGNRNFNLLTESKFLRLRTKHRIPLLELMDSKLPHLHFCYDCLGLHGWHVSQVKFSHATQPNHDYLATTCIGGNQSRRELPLYTLPLSGTPWYKQRFVHVQLVMRRLFLGPDFGVTPESLRYTEVSIHGAITSLLSVEARVTPGDPYLYLRIQRIVESASQFE